MKLLNADKAIIPREKLSGYLLSPHHPIGRFKAGYFRTLGYDESGSKALGVEIRKLLNGSVEDGGETGFGKKYLVRDVVTGSNGRSGAIVTVWIILTGESVPRFVTAYPENES